MIDVEKLALEFVRSVTENRHRLELAEAHIRTLAAEVLRDAANVLPGDNQHGDRVWPSQLTKLAARYEEGRHER